MGKVGTRLSVNANYDTQSTFAFQNLIKLEYDPSPGGEDSILKKLEVGNVSMPLNSSLNSWCTEFIWSKSPIAIWKNDSYRRYFSEQKSQTKR